MISSAAQATLLLVWASAAFGLRAPETQGADCIGFVQKFVQVDRADADEDSDVGQLWSPRVSPSEQTHAETRTGTTEDSLSIVKTLSTMASSPVDMVSSLAATPVEVVELGGPVLVAKAKIAGNALVQAVSGSVREIEDGNLTGAWEVTQQAITHAQDEDRNMEKAASAASSTSFGILVVVIVIVLCWVTEFVLTKRYDQAASEPVAQPEEPPFLNAFGFMRFLMAWHVVLFNFYEKGTPVPIWLAFSRWGEIAVPWFFLLSGFVNSYWKIVGPKADVQEEWLWAMLRRVATWYPLFVISIVWCAIRSLSIGADDWNHFLANMLLIHGIFFDPMHQYFPWMRGDWWLCYLMVYLLAFTPMHSVFEASGRSVIWTMFVMATLIVIPSAIAEWFFMGSEGFFVLIQYWPSFLFGQALAFWFVRTCMQQRGTAELVYVMRPVHDIPGPVRFGATLSTLILGIIYFLFSPQDKFPLIHKSVQPIVFKGALLPLMGLQIAAFASEVDPLAKFFARKPFRWGEKLALTTFMLQVPIHNTLEDWTGWKGMSWTFFAVLLVVSVLGHYGLERPWCNLLKARTHGLGLGTQVK